MRRTWLIVWSCCLWALTAQAQSPLTVGYQKTLQVPIPGATAAYSLDSNIAEATASNGVVQVTGKGAGTTNIVVVTASGAQPIPITVPAPKPVLPPGFDAPVKEGSAAESGNYEVRYNSDPAQVTNSLTMQRTEGQSFERLQIVNSDLFTTASTQPRVGIPLASYEISRPRRDIVFVDQTVENSPLTLDRYPVRGLHWREGDWQFHGGITTIATFQGLFLVTDPETTFGISRILRKKGAPPVGIDRGGGLSADLRSSSLTANLYFFKNPGSQQTVAPNGFVGSLVYKLRYGDKASLLSELGVSRGLALAVRGRYETEKSHAIGDFRIEPKRFPSLAVNNQHGTFADLNVARDLSARLRADMALSESNYNLPRLRQSTFTNNLLLNYKLTSRVSVSGGSAFSRFSSQTPVAPVIQTLNLPAAIDYSVRHFGAGFQYQRTINFETAAGNDFAVNARSGWGPFQLSAYFRHDVQVPTLAAIFAQFPGLQDLLDRAGIVVTTPDQLAQLLRDTALLSILGFTAPLSVNVAPARNTLSAAFTWIQAGASRRQFNLSYFNSDTQLIQGKSTFTTVTASYSQRLGRNNDVVASASVLRTGGGGASTLRPLFGVSLQHRFFTVPTFLLPGRHGAIEGHIFHDDESAGQYSAEKAPVAGVEVVLDDSRVTHTDANGHYSFHHVPFGTHRVEAKFQSAEPFFYTTDSPAVADMNATVDFGINFAKGQVYGFLLNDAGMGVADVSVELRGANIARSAQTTTDGKFTFLGLEPGTYSLSTRPESYPMGYSLQNLQTVQVTVIPGSAARTEMRVKAIRAVSGKVTIYDRSLGRAVSLAGVTVRLKELSQEVISSETGAYIFRNLPAGTYTISITWAEKEIPITVVVPEGPVSIRNADLNAGVR